VLYRLLQLSGWVGTRRSAAAAIGAAVFLVHPLQTESVSYIAGRSESLAALFMLLAYLVFIYRRDENISWRESLLVLVLSGLAVSVKENAVSIVGVIILTDVFWPVPFSLTGLRKNRKLYLLMLPAAIVAAVLIFRLLVSSSSAGFAVPVSWYQYGFTEARAFFSYVRLALLPIGQSMDHDYSISHTVWEHGAIVYLILLGAISAFFVVCRRRYPLACFGLLMTLILLAPTSSIVPINDPLVERRMYLPLIGLILIGCDLVSRVRVSTRAAYAAAVAMLIGYAVLCYRRNQLWSNPWQLWAAAASHATTNVRPYTNLIDELIQEHHCDYAIPYLERAEGLFPNNYSVEMSWGRALECLGRREEALQRLQGAAALQPGSYVYQLIGLLYAELGSYTEAGAALQKAVKFDPGSVGAHNALALLYEAVSDLPAAEKEYRTILTLDRDNPAAKLGLARVRQALGTNK
jgi:hypothetical protein